MEKDHESEENIYPWIVLKKVSQVLYVKIIKNGKYTLWYYDCQLKLKGSFLLNLNTVTNKVILSPAEYKGGRVCNFFGFFGDPPTSYLDPPLYVFDFSRRTPLFY